MLTSVPQETDASAGLRRSISLPWLVLYGLGTTIGAGVYALTGVVAGRAGMQAPLAFLVASLLALFSALSFAELSSRFPRAGGEAVYVLEGFGSLRLSRIVGLLVVLAGLVSAATVCVGMVGYLSALVSLPRTATIVMAVVAVGVVAGYGVRESVVAAGLMTLLEVGGLFAVIGAGAGNVELARLPELLPGGFDAWSAVGGAAILCFYAFLGFEDMVNVAEEVHDVHRVLPQAILLTLVITAVLYSVLSSVAVLTVPPEELAASEAPLSLIFERGGGAPQVLAVIAIFALANGALVQVVKASRVIYGMAREGAFWASLGTVHPWTQTPLRATALVGLVAGIFALSLPLASLAELTSVVTLLSFAAANAALFVLKRRGPAPPHATEFPLAVPALGFLASAGFLGFELSRLFTR
jgi:amino acid transporter